ncbi:MAG: glutathione peroxidase [Legionella sp.]
MAIKEGDDLYDVPVQTMDGLTTNLSLYKGQVLLIVNVASRCGFTSQYTALQQLHHDFHHLGFSVLAFPCDQFLRQEPGSNQEIKSAATACFNITFPLFAKLNVYGPQRSPLYTYLAKNIQKKPFIFIPWNFTKVLVDSNGAVIRRYLPTTSISKLRSVIANLLQKKPPCSESVF